MYAITLEYNVFINTMKGVFKMKNTILCVFLISFVLLLVSCSYDIKYEVYSNVIDPEVKIYNVEYRDET